MEARLISVPDMGYLITDTYHGRVIDKDGKVIQEGIPCNLIRRNIFTLTEFKDIFLTINYL